VHQHEIGALALGDGADLPLAAEDPGSTRYTLRPKVEVMSLPACMAELPCG